MTTFAFIHGAGDVGWYWHLVEADLRDLGHETVAPDLPIEDDTAGLARYADVIVDAIGARPNVVVVGQSFGGYVAPIVADRIDARLIVLVAGMVPAQESAEIAMELLFYYHLLVSVLLSIKYYKRIREICLRYS